MQARQLIPFVLIFTVWLTSSTQFVQQIKFTSYKNITGLPAQTGVAFSLDQRNVLLYDVNSIDVRLLDGYDYSLQLVTQIKLKPTYITFFKDPKGQETMLSIDSNGNYAINLDEPKPFINTCQVSSVSISETLKTSQTNILLISCKGDTNIYQFDLVTGDNNTLNFEVEVRSVSWDRSGHDRFVAAGGQKTANGDISKVLICQYPKNTCSNNYAADGESAVASAVFSADGNKIAYVETILQTSDETQIKIVDIATQMKQYLVANHTEGIYKLQINGDFLSAYDRTSVFVWIFNDKIISKLDTNLIGGALSVIGDNLVTQVTNQIAVYKFCPKQGQVYIAVTKNCSQCQSPCLNCYGSTTTCVSCVDSYYLEIDKCSPCLQNCKKCTKKEDCSQCFTGYYFTGQQCAKCSDSLDGCSKCNTKDFCTQCNINQHWILNTNTNQCDCAVKYVKQEHTCVACGKGCYLCQSADICTTCDITAHRQFKPDQGKCLCQDGYFQKQNVCLSCSQEVPGCTSCILDQDLTVTCQKCDTINHWQISGKGCVCLQGYAAVKDNCIQCPSLFANCKKCVQTKCDICADTFIFSGASCVCPQGQQINADTNRCQTPSSSSLLVILLVGGAVLIALGVGGYFIYKRIKNRRIVNTLIETEEDQLGSKYKSME